MKNYKLYQLILILTPFVFSFAFGLDIYIPIVPDMAQIFDTTPAMVQLTLSLFLFTTGAGQLLIGPLADQFGRRNIFFASSVCFALGSLGCAFSTHIAELIFCRFVSALGACGMIVTAFATVRDLYSGDECAKVYSFLNGAIGISPTFAPILGGYLCFYFGWKSIFVFLALIGSAAFLITQTLITETQERSHRVKIDRQVFQRYIGIFKNRQFLIYSTLAGLAEAVFFCFFSISPFIIIDLLDVPTHEFGYYFAAFGAVIGLGGFASGKIVEKIGIEPTVRLGIALMFLGGISMLIWHFAAGLNLAGFLIPMVIACTGAMFLVGASAAAALEPFGSIAGTASAGFGAMEFGLSAVVGALLMLYPVASTVPYGICIVALGILCTYLFSLRRPLKAIAEA